jgi:excisionase family DNA binding protein
MQQQEREYTLDELAVILGLSLATVRRAISRREIGHYRRGTGRGQIRVRQSQLDQFLRSRERPATIAA